MGAPVEVTVKMNLKKETQMGYKYFLVKQPHHRLVLNGCAIGKMRPEQLGEYQAKHFQPPGWKVRVTIVMLTMEEKKSFGTADGKVAGVSI